MQTICHEKKNQKPCQTPPPVKTPVESMTLLSKFEELIRGADPNRIKLLEDSVYKDVRRIKDPEVLISDSFLPAFKFCHKQQKFLPGICWSCCEKKVIEFINDPKFSGFFNSTTKKRLILFGLPSDAIRNALYQKEN